MGKAGGNFHTEGPKGTALFSDWGSANKETGVKTRNQGQGRGESTGHSMAWASGYPTIQLISQPLTHPHPLSAPLFFTLKTVLWKERNQSDQVEQPEANESRPDIYCAGRGRGIMDERLANILGDKITRITRRGLRTYRCLRPVHGGRPGHSKISKGHNPSGSRILETSFNHRSGGWAATVCLRVDREQSGPQSLD